MSDRDRKPRFQRGGGKGPDKGRQFGGRRGGGRDREASPDGPVILYGWHTVAAALANPQRRIRKLWLTENAARRLADDKIELRVTPEIVRPEPDRRPARPGRRASGPAGGGRAAGFARYRRPAAGGNRAGARPDHRSAQCRRHPALGGGLRGQGHRHHGAAQPRSHRGAGEIRLRRAGAGADGDRDKSGARAERTERPGFHDRRARQRGQRGSRRDDPAGSRWRWCWAPRARACGD